MSERKPVAFGDLRGWIAALKVRDELQEVDGEVDWNIELGTIMRLAQGPGSGRAIIFNNIKDYNKPTSRCRRVFGSALNNTRRIAMMLGLPPETHARELVRISRTILEGAIPPKIVKNGPVKENIVTGKDVDLYEFPVPYWNRLDGGRYLITYAGVVTKDPQTGVMNVGVYRGMLAGRDKIPILMWRAQHIGHHVTEWQRAGKTEMPIAVAIGWEPSLGFCAGSPVPKGICEYDVMGAIRGAPVELVKCETVDLHVPASAEIVIEGFLGLDPETYMMEGPYALRVHRLSRRRPLAQADHPRHLHHPPQRSDPARHDRGLPARQLFGECRRLVHHACRHRLEDVLDRAGVPGITDVWCPPVQAGINALIRMQQTYRGQAKQAANALWGSSAAHVRYKHLTVVDDDIDIHDYAAVDWAIAHRVNAGEDDIVIMPATFGLGLDPSTRRRDRNPALFGTGKWNRVLIDATQNIDYDPDPDLGGARFPPTVWPREDDVAAAKARWHELGLDKPKR